MNLFWVGFVAVRTEPADVDLLPEWLETVNRHLTQGGCQIRKRSLDDGAPFCGRDVGYSRFVISQNECDAFAGRTHTNCSFQALGRTLWPMGE